MIGFREVAKSPACIRTPVDIRIGGVTSQVDSKLKVFTGCIQVHLSLAGCYFRLHTLGY